MPPMDERYLSRQEVADRLSVSFRTVTRLIARGQLEAIKLDTGTVRVPVSSLQKLIADSTNRLEGSND